MYPIEKILHIAKMQKGMMYSILVLLCCVPISSIIIFSALPDPSQTPNTPAFALMIIVGIVLLVASLGQFIYYFRLAFAMEVGAITIALYLVGIFLPLLSLIMLFWLNGKATRLIRESGFKVGMIGANLKEIEVELFNTERYQETFN